MHHPTDRIIHTTTFVTPVVEHWLERDIAQWVHPMKDRPEDLSHHERTLLPRRSSEDSDKLIINSINDILFTRYKQLDNTLKFFNTLSCTKNVMFIFIAYQLSFNIMLSSTQILAQRKSRTFIGH